jgi:pyruvate/2-oxoglutarate dehydrogenase complex dihydrolipoamide acyltransferase (E2) component
MPQLGESVAEGTIGKWLKQPGDHVAKYEPLLEVITDKVNAEVPSPFEGILKEILVEEGATVPNNAEIAVIEEAGRGRRRRRAAAPRRPAAPTLRRPRRAGSRAPQPRAARAPAAPAPRALARRRRPRRPAALAARRRAPPHGPPAPTSARRTSCPATPTRG